MSKPLIIALHGMGEHDRKSFRKEIADPLNNAISYFSNLKNSYHFAARLEDDDHGPAELDKGLDLVVIEYNTIFNELRKELSDNAGTIQGVLDSIGLAPELISRLVSLDVKLNQNKFFYTHLLDVIFYETFYQNKVQVHVARQILETFKNNTHRPIHFIGHSLGTKVLHDTLHKLYKNQFTSAQKDEMGNYVQLDPESNRIDTINMVANVSKLVPLGADAYLSAIKAGEEGVCNDFINCRHVLDPFTVVRRFLPESIWPVTAVANYKNIVINGVERKNVHDIEHYLADPKVYEFLFLKYFGEQYYPLPGEAAAARNAHRQTTLQGNFDNLKDKIEQANLNFEWVPATGEFKFPSQTDFDEIIAVFSKLKDVIDSLNI